MHLNCRLRDGLIADTTEMTAPVKSSQNARALIDRLVKLTSTIPGLDSSLMVFQYSSPVIVALLLRLAKIRQSSSPKDATGLVGVAAGVTKAAASVSDARVIMRAFGEAWPRMGVMGC